MNFLEEINLIGRWWIPNDSNEDSNEIFGELIYKKHEGISLVLEGSFYNTKSIFHCHTNISIATIHGTLKNGQYISLINAWGNEAGRNEWIYTYFNVEFVLMNKEGYLAFPETQMSTFNFSTNSLNNFFDGYTNAVQMPENTDKFLKFGYKEKEPLEIINNDILNVYFYFSYNFNGLGEEDFSFKEKVFFNIEYKQPQSFALIVSNIRYYRDFFTFFSFPVVSFEQIHLYFKTEEGNPIELDLLFKDQAKEIGQRVPVYETLIFYKELANNFKEIFQKWVDLEFRNRGALALYMQLSYLKFPSDIQSFLNIVFAIETLHNTYFTLEIFSNDQLLLAKQQRKNALKSCISPEFHKRALECLSHFSSPTFSQRLSDLIDKQHSLISMYIYDKTNFVNKVTKQRNYLAHNHGDIEGPKFDSTHYPYFIGVLRLIFDCSLLKVLGLNDNQIKTIISRNYNYDKQKRYVLSRKIS